MTKQAKKEKSRRQQIRDCIDRFGDDAARALGRKIGLSDATCNAYIKDYPKVKARIAETGKASLSTAKAKPAKNGAPLPANYDYASLKAARKAADDRASLCGMHPSVFSTAEKRGKFAFIPVHQDKSIAPPQFTKDQRVCDRTRPARLGIVKEPGEQVSGVKFDDGREYYINNHYVMPHGKAPAAKKERVKAGKAKRK